MIKIVNVERGSKIPVLSRAAFCCDHCGTHIEDVDTAGYYFDSDPSLALLGHVLVMHKDCAREVERRRGQRFTTGELKQLFEVLVMNAQPISNWK